MESYLGLMLEQNWTLYMVPLIILMMARLGDCCLEIQCDLLMVKLLALITASNWDYVVVKN